jgi:carbonic anhydrase
MSKPPFVAATPYEAGHPRALAIYCSDGRFTTAIEELLAHLGHPRLDTLTLPGGAALLNAWSASVLDSDHAQRAAKFLITGHDISHVVLVAHAGCGYYRQRFPGERNHRDAQIADLHAATRVLASIRSSLDGMAYLATPEGGRVRFEPVPRKG